MKNSPAELFRSLRSFNFRIWTAGSLISNVGTWMQRTAQDWLVLTQLTHHDASAVGIVMALQFGPQLLFLPWTGFAADHFNQRKLLMVTQGSMGLLSVALGALTIAGVIELWQVYLFALLLGCVSAFDAPVRQTFVGELVTEEDLHNGVALNSTTFNAARMVGPAAAGLIIASIGTGWAFVINGASYSAVLIALARLRVRELHAQARAHRAKGSFAEGLRYVRSRPDLLAILAMLFLVGTFGLNFPIFISTMAVSVLHTDARGYGVLSSILAIGTITGALAAGSSRPLFSWLLTGAAVFGIAGIIAAMAPGFWSFAAALVVVGASALLFINSTTSLMQLTTEPAMRGRVMALRVGVALGCTPIGAPFVGWVADRFGPRWALALGASSGIGAAIVAIYAMVRRIHHPPGGAPGKRLHRRADGDEHHAAREVDVDPERSPGDRGRAREPVAGEQRQGERCRPIACSAPSRGRRALATPRLTAGRDWRSPAPGTTESRSARQGCL